MIATRNLPTVLEPSPSMSVNALLHWYPSLLPVLNGLGIDTCCGGAESLECAARAAEIPLERLMADVAAAVERTVAPGAPSVVAAARLAAAASLSPHLTSERRRNR
jgi:regulator of cell morphogenesis and NO signaling